MPSFEKSNEKENQREQLLAEYADRMKKYQSVTNKVRALERGHIPGAQDPALNFEIKEVDKERHETHLGLIEIAKRLGKTQQDVLIDIIRYENTLKEYGLPEFSILKSSDIVNTSDWEVGVAFNLGGEPEPLDKLFGEYEFGKDIFGEKVERLISEDEVLLVFSVIPITNWGGDEERSEDYEERVGRAKALAKEISGKYFDENDGAHHATSARIIGVVMPKQNLEKVAAVIRDNPEKFRLGSKFYN